eukprot:CAMPEP_0172153084 /NCGR_PEP_ID=MMETSP1050-20130122/1224_1 /TAXON_ID=233186 /ORGANISM="Cryptomonas curvata, Strain CCAP979/52" /LENGTH=141 /DNA_ID=CAMNT_0012821533 /DNA_START=47 /DNA_END=473 /DNA_ORIENTATION=-
MLTYASGFNPTTEVEPFFAGIHTSSNPAASPHVLGAGYIRGHPTFSSMILPHNLVYTPTNHPKENGGSRTASKPPPRQRSESSRPHAREHPDGVFISLQAVPPRSRILTARRTRLASLVVPQPCGMPSSPPVAATLQETSA